MSFILKYGHRSRLRKRTRAKNARWPNLSKHPSTEPTWWEQWSPWPHEPPGPPCHRMVYMSLTCHMAVDMHLRRVPPLHVTGWWILLQSQQAPLLPLELQGQCCCVPAVHVKINPSLWICLPSWRFKLLDMCVWLPNPEHTVALEKCIFVTSLSLLVSFSEQLLPHRNGFQIMSNQDNDQRAVQSSNHTM